MKKLHPDQERLLQEAGSLIVGGKLIKAKAAPAVKKVVETTEDKNGADQ